MFLQRSGSKACNSGIDTCCLCPWMQQDDTCHWTALPFLRECQISGGKQWICAVIWHCCGSIRLNCFQSSVILSGLWCCCECQEVSTPHFAALQVPIMFQWTITFVSLKLSEPCLVQPGSWLFLTCVFLHVQLRLWPNANIRGVAVLVICMPCVEDDPALAGQATFLCVLIHTLLWHCSYNLSETVCHSCLWFHRTVCCKAAEIP